MKKITLIFSLFLVLFLVGCGNNEAPTNDTKTYEDRFEGIEHMKTNIVTDTETGCKYFYITTGGGYGKTGAMSPLYKTDGTVDCGQ